MTNNVAWGAIVGLTVLAFLPFFAQATWRAIQGDRVEDPSYDRAVRWWMLAFIPLIALAIIGVPPIVGLLWLAGVALWVGFAIRRSQKQEAG